MPDVFWRLFERFEKAYVYFLKRLDRRYYPKILGLEGIKRYVHLFPYFAKRICRKANMRNQYYDQATQQYVTTPGLSANENSFRISILTDGSCFEYDTPGTGPAGDFIGA